MGMGELVRSLRHLYWLQKTTLFADMMSLEYQSSGWIQFVLSGQHCWVALILEVWSEFQAVKCPEMFESTVCFKSHLEERLLGESEAWKGLRTAVTSLAPAGRGVWGLGTQKPQGTYAFVRFHLTPYHSKKQKILDSWKSWNSRGRWAASLYINKWIADPHHCLSLMSVSLAPLRGMACRMGVSAFCLWIAQKDLDQPGP